MIKIIDYKAGNAPSVLSAVKHLGYEASIARIPEELDEATHIILPGVGAASATMQSLSEKGFVNKLNKLIREEKRLFLGVCVGMQILFEHSAEEGVPCLGWLKGRTIKFDESKVKVPQIGWNVVKFIKDTAIEAPADDYYYFVNSYHVEPADESVIWATADYGGNFTAAVQHDNIYATQFHVEKSGEAGLLLLNRFLSINKCKEASTC